MKKLILFLLSVVFTANIYAQQTVSDANLAHLLKTQEQSHNQLPVEKVYLHLDKPYYGAGDTIWFKGYTVTGSDHTLSTISGILNVDLINSNNYIVQSIKLPMVSGLSYGDFALPDTSSAGRYRVRAWTNWMRNFGEEYFYDRDIDIVNAITINKPVIAGKIKTSDTKQAIGAIPVPTKNNIDVQFFPEGGYMVNGIANKVAFKAVGVDGLGKDIKGTITDDQNNEIASIASTHLGMGMFLIAPQTGRTYTANIIYPDGSTATIALPTAKDDGYVMAVNNLNPDNIAVKITSVNTTDLVTLIAQSGGEVCYEGKSVPGKPMFLADIPKSKFRSGIVKLTLFSNLGEPLNERLIFVKNKTDDLDIAVNTIKQTSPRRKVKVDINVKDNNGRPVTGNFSAAVINETQVPMDENTESTILSNLLLTSDLKGYVEQPNYYFSNINEKTNANLDILMLTQGYSRYEWKSVNDNENPQIAYQPEKDLSISGKVMMLWGKPDANNKVFLIAKNGGFPLDTITDKDGHFVFNQLTFSDTAKFIIKTPTERDKDNVTITVDNDAPKISSKNWGGLQTVVAKIDSNLDTYIKVSKQVYDGEVKYGIGNHGHLLKEININRERPKSERQKEEEEATLYSANLNGKGVANQVITADDIEMFGGSTLADRLNGRLVGVEFHNSKTGLQPFLGRGMNQMSGTNFPMLVVLDGIIPPGNGWDVVNNEIPPSNIESIEVLRSIEYRATYGSRGSGGVLIITTKHGGQEHVIGAKAPGILDFTAKGYYLAHQFYSPKYDSPATASIPDLRTTIYWKPIIQPDKDGKASLEFFNADSKGTYRIVVEGIDNEGHIGRQVYRYKVD